VWFYHRYYGNCFTWNTHFDENKAWVGIKEALTFDFESGLHMQIFLGFPPLNASEKMYSFSYSKGAFISINNQSYIPIEFEGFEAKPGLCSIIQLKKTHTTKLTSPYSDCLNLNEEYSFIYNRMISLNYTYRQKVTKSWQVFFENKNYDPFFFERFVLIYACRNT
jgi:hypothetical protein